MQWLQWRLTTATSPTAPAKIPNAARRSRSTAVTLVLRNVLWRAACAPCALLPDVRGCSGRLGLSPLYSRMPEQLQRSIVSPALADQVGLLGPTIQRVRIHRQEEIQEARNGSMPCLATSSTHVWLEGCGAHRRGDPTTAAFSAATARPAARAARPAARPASASDI